MWADGQPNVVKAHTFPVAADAPLAPLPSSDIFPACAITRVASRDAQRLLELEHSVLPDSLFVDQLAGSLSALFAEQQADLSLKELFDRVMPAAKVRDTAQGYCHLNGLLVRKWLLHQDTAVGEPVFQVVGPTALRQKVLQASHGNKAGNFGVGKTYDRILEDFFFFFGYV